MESNNADSLNTVSWILYFWFLIKFKCIVASNFIVLKINFFFFDEQDNIIYSTIVNTLCVEIKSGKLCYNILEIISILCHSYYGKWLLTILLQ